MYKVIYNSGESGIEHPAYKDKDILGIFGTECEAENIRDKIQAEIDKLQSEKQNMDEDLGLFLAEEGWQDWMNEYTEAEEGEPITEKESEKITAIQKLLFKKAHEE